MSVYKVRVFKEESLSAEYRVTCVQGGDPGRAEDLPFTEAEADGIFEREFHDFVTVVVAGEGDFITTSAVSDGGGVVSSRV
jgi:hypothetical protein